VPYRHRGERARGRGRRGVNRLVAVVAGAALVYVVVFPVTVAIIATHKPREAIGAPPSAAYRPVTFNAGDGLRLSGWYVPSENRAAVVIVHGGGGDRTGSLRHAALLARHGYGVLVYDARGRGASQGASNQFGWDWPKDVQGALAFLRHRPDVDPHRIGGLGLSTGADVLLQVAAERRHPLGAAVGDGATTESLADARNGGVSAPDLPYWAVMYTAASILSGSSPGDRRSRTPPPGSRPRRCCSSRPEPSRPRGASTASTRASRTSRSSSGSCTGSATPPRCGSGPPDTTAASSRSLTAPCSAAATRTTVFSA